MIKIILTSFFLFLLIASESIAQESAAEAEVAPAAQEEVLPWLVSKEEEKKGPELFVSIEYSVDQIEIPSESLDKIDELIQNVKNSDEVRVNIKSYATTREGRETMARRMSLKRALSIRKYMIGKGVEPIKIIVNALGDKVEGSAADIAEIYQL